MVPLPVPIEAMYGKDLSLNNFLVKFADFPQLELIAFYSLQ